MPTPDLDRFRLFRRNLDRAAKLVGSQQHFPRRHLVLIPEHLDVLVCDEEAAKGLLRRRGYGPAVLIPVPPAQETIKLRAIVNQFAAAFYGLCANAACEASWRGIHRMQTSVAVGGITERLAQRGRPSKRLQHQALTGEWPNVVP